MPLGSVVIRVGLRPRLSGRGGGRSRPARGRRSELSRAEEDAADASAAENRRAAAAAVDSNPHSCRDGTGSGQVLVKHRRCLVRARGAAAYLAQDARGGAQHPAGEHRRRRRERPAVDGGGGRSRERSFASWAVGRVYAVCGFLTGPSFSFIILGAQSPSIHHPSSLPYPNTNEQEAELLLLLWPTTMEASLLLAPKPSIFSARGPAARRCLVIAAAAGRKVSNLLFLGSS